MIHHLFPLFEDPTLLMPRWIYPAIKRHNGGVDQPMEELNVSI
jgi:hypothetical protein